MLILVVKLRSELLEVFAFLKDASASGITGRESGDLACHACLDMIADENENRSIDTGGQSGNVKVALGVRSGPHTSCAAT